MAGEGGVGGPVAVATALASRVMEVGALGGGLEAACPVVGALVEAAAAKETEGYRSTHGTPHTFERCTHAPSPAPWRWRDRKSRARTAAAAAGLAAAKRSTRDTLRRPGW